MTAPLVLVEHDTANPAEDCVVAASVHALLQNNGREPIAFRRLVSEPHVQDPIAHQHVAAAGALMNNAWLWPERLAAQAAEPAGEIIPDQLDPRLSAVIACNASCVPGFNAAALASSWSKTGPVVHVQAINRDGALTAQMAGENGKIIGRWIFDDWARPQINFIDLALLHATSEAPAGWNARSPSSTRVLAGTILIVGDEHRLRYVYPAILAALGDAADALDLAPSVQFVSPRGLTRAQADDLVRSVDGIVLPGGCDNSQVDGQIVVAAAALAADVPTLGSCFGMQTMATAFVRERLGATGAHLEEIEPNADPLVFTAMAGPDGAPMHRLGARSFAVLPGTIARTIYGQPAASERMHHRFRLDPILWRPLQTAGLIISGKSAHDGIADVIEVPDCRFFVGVQGHPELSSGSAQPHPAFKAFLAATVGEYANSSHDHMEN